MSKPRILIAAPRSGSGKTLITCSLLMALKKRGINVGAFKSGPDYIDPMFHKTIIGVPSRNLDLFFTDQDTTRSIFLKGNENDISIIEGAMGLYDGLGGTTSEASAYELADTLEAPIILVVDARGMGRSILAEIAGFMSMDTKHLIKGVILNKISGMFFKTISPVIEAELGVKVYGYFEKQEKLGIESRYLGLVLPNEIEDIVLRVEEAATELEKTVDIDGIIELAESAPDICCDICHQNAAQTTVEVISEGINPRAFCANEELENVVRIAVARDEAFCFYYEDNLRILEELGAKLIYFSPIHDKELPKDIDGLILGGGYPELWAKMLTDNHSMRKSIKTAIDENLPVFAECGGFMYLHDSITAEDGIKYQMVGAIKGNCHYVGKLVRFGYVDVSIRKDVQAEADYGGLRGFLNINGNIKAHEFHYYDSDSNGEGCTATKPVTGRSFNCVHVKKNQWMGFPHIYFPSNPEFPKAFVDVCRERKAE